MKRNQHIDNALLVERCKKGDREAMNLLYTRFAPRMLSLIQHYIDDLNDAQDILHDGFIVAFTRLDSLKNTDRVDYWLATIMRNLSLKFLKSHDVAQILHELPETDDVQPIENIIDFDILLSLIETLPAGYKNVFRLAVFENKSHKEISQILGIAPNSSSSQLFRAKIQLRRLINDYKNRAGLLSLFLILSMAGIIYVFRNMDNTNHITSISQVNNNVDKGLKKRTSKTNSKTTSSHISSSSTLAHTATPNSSFSRKSLISLSYNPKQDTNPKDSVINYNPDIMPNQKEVTSLQKELTSSPDSMKSQNKDYEYLTDLDYPSAATEKRINKQWTLSFSFNTGISNTDLTASEPTGNGGINGGSGNNNGNHNGDVGSDNPDSPGHNLDSTGDDSDDKKQDTRAGYRESNRIKPLSKQSHHNHLPISFALTVQKNLSSRFAVETGLNYTYLHTTFEDAGFITECHWHYLGIPLKLNITVYSAPKVSIYGSLGGTFYYPIHSSASEKWLTPSLRSGRFHSNPVGSIGAGLGFSYNISNRMSLYFEPSIHHYYRNKDKIPNLWTDESWGFSFPIGLRFNW